MNSELSEFFDQPQTTLTPATDLELYELIDQYVIGKPQTTHTPVINRELSEIIAHFQTTPLSVLCHRTMSPMVGLEKRLRNKEYDKMSDDEFYPMRDEVGKLSNTLWRRQTIVHPDTLLGRLIMESRFDKKLPERFLKYEHLMDDGTQLSEV